MNADTLAIIKTECEKIEKEPGFGKVLISIEHGTVRIIPDNIVGVLSVGDNLARKQGGIVNVTPLS